MKQNHASLLFSNNFFWSARVSLLLFTSPVLIYYGNNFLSNSAALAFTLMGWYFFLRCKLNQSSPFGIAMRLNDLKAGGSIQISVWRRNPQDPDAGTMIVSAENYYNKTFKRIGKDHNGWEKIEKEVFISSALEGKELGVYFIPAERNPFGLIICR